MIVRLHKPPAMVHDGLVAEIHGIGNGHPRDGVIRQRPRLEGTQEEALAVDHGAGVGGILQQVGRDERHLVRVRRGGTARSRATAASPPPLCGEPVGVLDQAERVPVDIDDGHAEGLKWSVRSWDQPGFTEAARLNTPPRVIGPAPNSLNCRPFSSMRQPTPCLW